MQTGPNETGCLSIHLLNASNGRVLQTWEFQDQSRITLGRGDENQVRISEQQVSRLHLELIFENGGWQLISHGRNGTRINDNQVSKVTLEYGTVFQLGPGGPSFRFDMLDSSAIYKSTITSQDDIGIDHLFIDEEKKTEEVNQIVEGDAFRALKEQARKLREKKLQ